MRTILTNVSGGLIGELGEDEQGGRVFKTNIS